MAVKARELASMPIGNRAIRQTRAHLRLAVLGAPQHARALQRRAPLPSLREGALGSQRFASHWPTLTQPAKSTYSASCSHAQAILN
jgi:hypothetical protein